MANKHQRGFEIRSVLLAGLATGAIGATALAAVALQPDLPGVDESEQAERLVPREPGEAEAFSPEAPSGTAPIRPGLTQGSSWADLLGDREPTDEIPLLAERTFLNALRGSVIGGPHGTLIFIPNDADASALGPMLLLPCRALERFDEFAFQRRTRMPAVVSGQVFLYDARNYLLPSTVRVAVDDGIADLPESGAGQEVAVGANDPASGQPSDQASGSEPELASEQAADASAPTEPAPQEPGVSREEVESLINELEQRPVYNRRRARAGSSDAAQADAAGGSDDDAGSPAPVTSPDGTYVSGLRGRIVRSLEGSWTFIGDGDTGDAARLTLLPCRMLQALEGVALRAGDSASVIVSGRVYRFKGDDYLLPTLFERERRDGIDPLQ